MSLKDKMGCVAVASFFIVMCAIGLIMLIGDIARAFVWLKWAFS